MDKDLVLILESLIYVENMFKGLCLWATAYNKCVNIRCFNCPLSTVPRYVDNYPVQLIKVFRQI